MTSKNRIALTVFLLGILCPSCFHGHALDRQWTIFLIQQTHTDIGYTRPQSEILSEHLRYIDYAVDFCNLTLDYPEEARFKWTCEAAWAVEEYIRQRPATRAERLKDCIRRGQIEVTGMYFNLSDMIDEEALKYFFHPLKRIRREGIPITAAMQNDVNGAAWCLTDYLHDMGVKYFWMGPNQTRSVLPFEVPTVFKWQSPSGNDVIAFRSMHYMTANFWGIEKNDSAKFRTESIKFLDEIAGKGYPYDAVGIQHLGYFVDNAPPSCRTCDFVREWNSTHDNPKLRTATASEFLDHICREYGTDNLPIQGAAWPDWWTDGFGSAAKETGQARKAHADMTAVTGLLSMAHMAGDKLPPDTKAEVGSTYGNLLFYDEHTFGASESVSDPGCWNSQIQFDNKASYAWTGLRKAKLLYETAGGLLQEHIRPYEDAASLTVFNPLLWDRDAYAEVFADYDIIPEGKKARLVSESGETAEMQCIKTAPEGRYFKVFARGVPSFGYRTYRIVLSDCVPAAADSSVSVLENRYYRIEFDAGRGGIVSIKDKLNSCRELVDPSSEWPLGAFIYETQSSRDVFIKFRTGGFTRERWDSVTLSAGVPDGNVYKSVILHGNTRAADANGVSCEVRLYRDKPLVELHYSMRRPAEFEPNAIYVAFPFNRCNPKLAMDVQGGVMMPGENQLEGSSNEWNTMQNFVSARGSGHQTVLTTGEIPVVLLGNLMQDGPMHYLKTYDAPHVFSCVMNNYWFTNFKASQQDEFSWSYVLTSSACDDDKADVTALKQAISERVGLYARIIPKKRGKVRTPLEMSFLRLDSTEGVIAVNSTPASFRDGVVIQVKNAGTEAGTVRFKDADGKGLALQRVNATEENIGRTSRELPIAAGGDIFVLVK